MIEAYPLCWPVGRPRARNHEDAIFRTSFAKARDKCIHEIYLLGGSGMVISTNIPLRGDGLPYANHLSRVSDTGVAVYFNHQKRQMCFACDRWWKVEDNMHAISLTINALRGIARWGTGDMMQAAFTGFTALPAPGQTAARGWRTVLELNGDASLDRARENYRRLASIRHPDKGGSNAAMAELNQAWKEAQGALQ